MQEAPIATRRILVFAAPLLPVFAGVMLVNSYYLKFGTDVLGLSPALMGTILLATRLWDAVTDPAVGWLSDRTTAAAGRRRPWIIGSALPFGLAMIMLWSPPRDLGAGGLAAWVCGAALLYYTAFTTFRVPHLALGAELSQGYHDRTRVFGVMQAVENVGMIGAAGALAAVEAADDPRSAIRALALVIAGVATASMFLSGRAVTERAAYQGRGGGRPARVFADVLRNPHARRLIAIFLAEQLGFSVLIVLLPYLSDYLLQTPGRSGLYLFGALAAALLSIPVWIRASRRFGKQPVWFGTIAAKSVVLTGALLLGEGDGTPFLAVTVAFGFLHGASAVVGPSLKADVIDWDESQSGERKEGAYFATWNFAQKAAAGLSGWMAGLALTAVGFVPNVAQTASTVSGLRAFAIGLPLFFGALALALVARFTLDESALRAAREDGEAPPFPS